MLLKETNLEEKTAFSLIQTNSALQVATQITIYNDGTALFTNAQIKVQSTPHR